MDLIPVVSLTVILYLVAEILKATVLKSDTQRTLLPMIGALIGAILALIAFIVYPDLLPSASTPIDAVLSGVASGLCATGGNQFYKQMKKRIEDFGTDEEEVK